MKHLKPYKLFESLEIEMNFDKIIEVLSTECSEFLDLLKEKNMKKYTGKNDLLYRGMSSAFLKDKIVDGFWKVIPPKNRPPRDMKPEISKKLDQEFEKKFGTTLRDKGVFATKDSYISVEYGKHPGIQDYREDFIFFPKNGFRYFWSPQIDDLYTELKDTTRWYDKDPFFWDSSDQKDFKEIVRSYKEGGIEEIGSQEITFICDEYYMLDKLYYDEFVDYLF